MNSKSFIRYKIHTLSPVIISDRSGDANMINSKSYITGNNVLGVFAGMYINKKISLWNKKFSGGGINNFNNINSINSTNTINNDININININNNIDNINSYDIYNIKEFHKDNIFFDWFINEKLIFTNAYVSDGYYDYFIPPASIMYDKHNETVAFELLDESADKNSSITFKKLNGFISINNDSIKKLHVKKSLSFHHARDKKTGTAKKGDIFNYESISEDQTFKGNIIGEKELLDDFVKMFGTKFPAYIGKSKNSQYGKVEIELEPPRPLENWGCCPEIKESGIYSDDYDDDDDSMVLTLLSDTIIYNENGFSTVNIDDFEKYLNKKLKDLLRSLNSNSNSNGNVTGYTGYTDLKVERAFVQNGRAEEFVGIWKLKNQSENVFSAGSCFMLKGLSTKYRHHEMLKKLCVKGIGEKAYEGFGRAVCAWQKKIESYRILKETSENERVKTTKPERECPAFVANLVKDIVKDNLLTEIKEEAMDNAHLFKNIPSKSLMGKLQLLVRADITGFRGKLDIIVGDNRQDKQQKKPAKIQLENSHNDKKNMLDFIKGLTDDKDDKFNIERLKNKNSGLFENLDEFIDSLKKDINFINNLKRMYFSTFFNFLRKSK